MKAAFHTLGCKVNQYETEAIARAFRRAGYEIVDERQYADVYVVNTCTVTAMADRKSRQYIRRMKKVNPESVVAVTGCYAQIKPEEVSAVDGVDIVAGTNEKGKLADYVADYLRERQAGQARKRLYIKGYEELDVYEETGAVTSAENRTRAYIKIQEGCNRFCAYCVIPYARGSVRSRELNSIVAEAEGLLAQGYKELVLTGINTALYGMEKEPAGRCFAGGDEPSAAGRADASGPFGVEQVIAALNALPGDFRIRLSSLEPAVVSAGYVKGLLKYDKLCHHLHLSAQSGSDRVLKAMNRPYGRGRYLDIVRVLRAFDPDYGISTDLIVGFPGEREKDFEDSCGLVEECAFCKTHIFKYSKRPFTKAAEMEGQIPPQVKNRRSDRLHQIAEKTSRAFFAGCAGKRVRVLLEEPVAGEKLITGYANNYTRVYLPWEDGENAARLVNTFVEVTLKEPFKEGMLAER